MNQFHWTRPTSYLGSRNVRRIAPRWQGGLVISFDNTQTVQKYDVGAPGTTYIDWSANGTFAGHYIQVTADGGGATNEWRYLPDAFGVPLGKLGGANGNVSIGTVLAAPNPTTGISISCWLRPDVAPAVGMEGDMGRGVSANTYSIGVFSGGIAYQVTNTGVGTVNLIFSQVQQVGVWHHYGLTWDLANMLCYYDGAFIGQKAIVGPPNNAGGGGWEFPGGWSNNTMPCSTR